MNETGSELRGWTRRNFLKAAGVAGCAMLFPWHGSQSGGEGYG